MGCHCLLRLILLVFLKFLLLLSGSFAFLKEGIGRSLVEGGLGDKTGSLLGFLFPGPMPPPCPPFWMGEGCGLRGSRLHHPQPPSLWGVRAGSRKGPAATRSAGLASSSPRYRAFPAAPPCGSQKSRMTWRSLTVPKLLACLTRFPTFLPLGKRRSRNDAGLLPNPLPTVPPPAPSSRLQHLCSTSLSAFPSLLSVLQKSLPIF